eukprot:10162293-Ditylum_brightwellii.AAC.1
MSEKTRGLTEKEKKIYEKALKEGEHIQGNIFRKLSDKEKEQLNKAKETKWKERNNRGLGSQYSINQQLGALPSGTILVPMLPQAQGGNSQNQVNNVNLDANSNRHATDSTAQQPPPAQESNQIRAANFLQLAN